MLGNAPKKSSDDITGILGLITNAAAKHTLATLEAPAKAIFQHDPVSMEKHYSKIVETLYVALERTHKEFIASRSKFNETIAKHWRSDSLSIGSQKTISNVCAQYTAVTLKHMYVCKALYILHIGKDEPSVFLSIMQHMSLVVGARARELYYSCQFEDTAFISYLEYLDISKRFHDYVDRYQDVLVKQYQENSNPLNLKGVESFNQISELISTLFYMSELAHVFADFQQAELLKQRAEKLLAVLVNHTVCDSEQGKQMKTVYQLHQKRYSEIEAYSKKVDRNSLSSWKSLFDSYIPIFRSYAQPRKVVRDTESAAAMKAPFENIRRDLRKIINKDIEAVLPFAKQTQALLQKLCTNFDAPPAIEAQRCLVELAHALSQCSGYKNNHLAWCIAAAMNMIKISMDKFQMQVEMAMGTDKNKSVQLVSKAYFDFSGIPLTSNEVGSIIITKKPPKPELKQKPKKEIAQPVSEPKQIVTETEVAKQNHEVPEQQAIRTEPQTAVTIEEPVQQPVTVAEPVVPQVDNEPLPTIEEVQQRQQENLEKFNGKLERKKTKEREQQELEIQNLTDAFSKVILDAKNQHQNNLKAMRDQHDARKKEIEKQHQDLLISMAPSNSVEAELLKQALSEEESALFEKNKVEIDTAWAKVQQRVNFVKQQVKRPQLPAPVAAIQIPVTTQIILNILEEHEVEYFILGGHIRDQLTDLEGRRSDMDVIVNLEPNALPPGILKYVTTDSRLPRLIKVGEMDCWCEPWQSVDETLKSKDFKFNTLVAKANGQVYDLLGGGLKSLRSPEIEVMGAVTRYQEDPILILRAIRFCIHMDKPISQRDWLYITENASLLRNIEVSAYIKNIERIFLSKHLMQDFNRALKHNVIALLFPICENAQLVYHLQSQPILRHYIFNRFDTLAKQPVNTDSVYYFIALMLLLNHDCSRPNLSPNIDLMKAELEQYFVWLGKSSAATSCLLLNAKLKAILFGSDNNIGLFQEYYSGKQQIEVLASQAQRTLTPGYQQYTKNTQVSQTQPSVHFPNKVSASNLFIPKQQ